MISKKVFHRATIKSEDWDHVCTVEFQETFVEKRRIGLRFNELDDITLCFANIETLQDKKLSQGDFENLDLVNLHISCLLTFLELLFNGYNSIVVVLALVINKVYWFGFQKTERI